MSLKLVYVAVLLIPFLLLLSGMGTAHYIPAKGDYFNYYEKIMINNGMGNYTGYTEDTYVNGTLRITSVNTNGTVAVYYHNSWLWGNSTGSSQSGGTTGNFTFSYNSFLYLHGTDNQTGYTRPRVWFLMNNSLLPSDQFYLLDTNMNVVSTGYSYDLGSGKYVKAIFAEGNGSYLRNDLYGKFTASYSWKAYFDPSTGYIIGYLYTEHDSDSAGNGFTYTDLLYVTATSYSLTPVSHSTTVSSGTGGSILFLILLIALFMVLLAVIIVIYIFVSKRHRSKIDAHSKEPQGSAYSYAAPLQSAGAQQQPYRQAAQPPPPINLAPQSQPAVQQIVIKETVKVRCSYCNSLIDSTAKVCPICGAPRN